MTDNNLVEMRKLLANIRTSIETSQAALEFAKTDDDPKHKEVKARTLESLKLASESLEEVVLKIGGIPPRVRH